MSFQTPPFNLIGLPNLKAVLEDAGYDGILVQNLVETELHKGMRMGQQVSIQVHRIDNQDFVATGNEYTVRVLGIIEKEYDTDPYWKKCRECYVLFDGDEIFEVLLVTGHGPHDWDGRKRNSVRQLILRENVRTPRGCSLREIGWSNIDRYFPA